MRKKDLGREDATSTTLGAILVFAVLLAALVYVNAYRVPEAGADAERAQARVLEAQAARLAATATTAVASESVTVTLDPVDRARGLFAGFVLDAAAPAGTLAFQPDGFSVRVSHVTPDGATVWDAGNATAFLPMGRVLVTTAGHYVQPFTFTVEGGAALTGTGSAAHVAHAPAWSWMERADGGRVASLVLPRFTGEAASVTDSGDHAVTLAPESVRVVTGRAAPTASNVTIEVDSAHANAWGAFLNRTFEPHAATVAGRVASITLTAPPGADLGLELAFRQYAVRVG